MSGIIVVLHHCSTFIPKREYLGHLSCMRHRGCVSFALPYAPGRTLQNALSIPCQQNSVQPSRSDPCSPMLSLSFPSLIIHSLLPTLATSGNRSSIVACCHTPHPAWKAHLWEERHPFGERRLPKVACTWTCRLQRSWNERMWLHRC